jgi:hypothetical protein
MRYNTDNDSEDAPWPNATNVVVVAVLVVVAMLVAYGAYKLFKYGMITL